MKTVAALAVVVAAGSAAMAVVVPNDRAGVAGNGSFLSPLANSARSYQWVIGANQLTGLLGQQIGSIALRALPSATVAWPAADTTYSNYDIYIAPAVDPSLATTVFANNLAGPEVQVRSGSITFAAGSYTVGSSPNAFGPAIAFGSGYLYTGGNLAVTIRQNGSNGTSLSTDAVTASSGPGSGYGVDFRSSWSSGYASAGTSQGNFAIIDLQPIPAPSAAALLGLGALVAGRRRR